MQKDTMLASHIGCLYLHGFLSSPHSLKAQQLQSLFDQQNRSQQLSIPTLPFAPAEAIKVVEQAYLSLLEQPEIKSVVVIGSSLGGFYATYLANKYSCKLVLINPAIHPYLLLDKYLGENTHYNTGEVHILTLQHIEQLKELQQIKVNQPKDCLLLLQTADETLDVSLASEFYRTCPSWLEAGGNHSFQDFTQRLNMIYRFAERSC